MSQRYSLVPPLPRYRPVFASHHHEEGREYLCIYFFCVLYLQYMTHLGRCSEIMYILGAALPQSTLGSLINSSIVLTVADGRLDEVGGITHEGVRVAYAASSNPRGERAGRTMQIVVCRLCRLGSKTHHGVHGAQQDTGCLVHK
jgi:hypothetical protein